MCAILPTKRGTYFPQIHFHHDRHLELPRAETDKSSLLKIMCIFQWPCWLQALRVSNTDHLRPLHRLGTNHFRLLCLGDWGPKTSGPKKQGSHQNWAMLDGVCWIILFSFLAIFRLPFIEIMLFFCSSVLKSTVDWPVDSLILRVEINGNGEHHRLHATWTGPLASWVMKGRTSGVACLPSTNFLQREQACTVENLKFHFVRSRKTTGDVSDF